jgi:hypothetical protein
MWGNLNDGRWAPKNIHMAVQQARFRRKLAVLHSRTDVIPGDLVGTWLRNARGPEPVVLPQCLREEEEFCQMECESLAFAWGAGQAYDRMLYWARPILEDV